jgi:hypothetical protein
MGQVKKLWFLGGWPVDKVLKGQKTRKRKKEGERKCRKSSKTTVTK